jgi:feruloyl esterase
MEAQRFPDDYQGILAGFPNNFWTHQAVAALYNTQVPGLTDRTNYIPSVKIAAISAAVLAACDAQDGVTDGIINDPRQCHFDPSTLLCQGPEFDSCLTSGQVAELKKIYDGLRDVPGGLVFPGYMPGGEEGEDGWKGWITGAAPGQSGIFVYASGYLRNMVFDNPTWDYRTVSAERAARLADEKTAYALNATDTDLRRFKARGGKLILYHGWSDPAAPPLNTINYYEAVVGKLGLRETEAFVRLYMVPGMQHGYGGVAPKFFGQFDLSVLGADPGRISIETDPQHNISSALEKWVEMGTAPASIIATKYVNDLDPAQGLKMTRPLCPYPQVAKYKGSGSTNDAANFVCAQDQR